jgi:hypothetical protein
MTRQVDRADRQMPRQMSHRIDPTITLVVVARRYRCLRGNRPRQAVSFLREGMPMNRPEELDVRAGYVPMGRKAEDGRIDDRYQLVELLSSSNVARTKRNVEESGRNIDLQPGK